MNKNIFAFFVIFVFGGILAGIVSLALSSLFPLSFLRPKELFPLATLVVIEEMAKFLAFWAILKSYSLFRILHFWQFIFFAIALGFGFGLFEAMLIILNNNSFAIAMLKPFGVHIITALLFGVGLALTIHLKKIFPVAIFLILSLLLHLWYNLTVVIHL